MQRLVKVQLYRKYCTTLNKTTSDRSSVAVRWCAKFYYRKKWKKWFSLQSKLKKDTNDLYGIVLSSAEQNVRCKRSLGLFAISQECCLKQNQHFQGGKGVFRRVTSVSKQIAVCWTDCTINTYRAAVSVCVAECRIHPGPSHPSKPPARPAKFPSQHHHHHHVGPYYAFLKRIQINLGYRRVESSKPLASFLFVSPSLFF